MNVIIESILSWIGYIDAVINIFSWIVIVFSISLLVRFQVKSYEVIYNFFRKDGLNRKLAIIISLRCRKSWERNVRIFIEYVVVTSTQSYLEISEWKEKIEEFSAKFLKSSCEVPTIYISNTFTLMNDIVWTRVNNYFEFIQEEKIIKILSIDRSAVPAFVSEINIAEGYLSSLVPIYSLQERYNFDWSKILNQYTKVLENDGNKYPGEVSSFYTWLMWGPSVSIIQNENEYKLGLIGLGDESMAVPIVVPSGVSNSIWNKISFKSSKNKMGLLVSGSYKLYDKQAYFFKMYNQFSNKTMHFINKEMESKSQGLILEDIGKSEIISSKNKCEYIFSAYIWIMLNYTFVGEMTGFNCNHSTVMFEHANIADSENVELLTNSLINKCIQYLEEIWSAKELYGNRIYNIPWAINNEVREQLIERIIELRNDNEYRYSTELKERVDLEMPQISQGTILENIDNEFEDDCNTVEYLNVDFDNEEHLALLGAFYCVLYSKEFPDENERESLDNILFQAKRMKDLDKCNYYCILALMGRKIVGGLIGDYFAKSNSGVIEFIVVSRDVRRQNIGTSLINNFIDFCNKDARRPKKSINGIDYCFFEVENPEKVKPEMKEKCEEGLVFYMFLHRIRVSCIFLIFDLKLAISSE